MKTQSLYIACFVWGKNPDELEKPKLIPGIDIPADPSLLRGFYG